jgi:hypothetical protein
MLNLKQAVEDAKNDPSTQVVKCPECDEIIAFKTRHYYLIGNLLFYTVYAVCGCGHSIVLGLPWIE